MIIQVDRYDAIGKFNSDTLPFSEYTSNINTTALIMVHSPLYDNIKIGLWVYKLRFYSTEFKYYL